jgi:predicted alpha/beta hydrolase
VKKAYIPAFFIAAKDDDFIAPKHTEKLHKAYAG